MKTKAPLKYTPWKELKITELEYYKRKYLEARVDVRKLLEALTKLMDDFEDGKLK